MASIIDLNPCIFAPKREEDDLYEIPHQPTKKNYLKFKNLQNHRVWRMFKEAASPCWLTIFET